MLELQACVVTVTQHGHLEEAAHQVAGWASELQACAAMQTAAHQVAGRVSGDRQPASEACDWRLRTTP